MSAEPFWVRLKTRKEVVIMMIYPSVDELMKKFDSRYSIVIAAAKRARELEDKENSAEPLVRTLSEKPVTIAVEEIYEGKIGYTMTESL